MIEKQKKSYLCKLPLGAVIRCVVLIAALVACLPQVSAQSNLDIRGTVNSVSDGLPLIGVNVLQKGTTNGTITDIEGHFRLNVPAGSEIEISYIGYINQSVRVTAGKTEYIINLIEDSKTLEEVVVIGYGVQKKSVVTAAISQVSGDELAKSVPTTFQNALKGKVSGVQIVSESGAPGANAKVRIRGIGTINNSDPLYLVDGMPVETINNINPSDIESVEVLKDAASAAIYGTRGANGVVLITTKKGSVSKPQLTYEVSYGWQNPTKKLDYMNAIEYQMMVNEMNMNHGKSPVYPNYNPNDPSTHPKAYTNWQDELLSENAMVYNHKLSLSGGNDRNLYFVSLGYVNQKGIVASEKSYYERYNARFNNTYTVIEDKSRFWLPKVTLETNINYSHTEKMGIGNNSDVSGVLTSMALTPPNEAIYQDDPTELAKYAQLYPNYVKDDNGRAYNIINMRELGNPMAVRQVSNNTLDKANDFAGNLGLNIGILPGLNFRTNFGFSWAFWSKRGYTPSYYVSTNNVNTTSSILHQKSERFTWQIENVLSYEKQLGKHNFSVLLGQSALSREKSGLYGDDYDLPRYGLDYAWLSSGAAERSQERVRDDIEEHKLASFFGRISYNYDERYMLSLVLRRDGSSNFGPENKYANFPSVSAGWNLTQESFMESRPEWLNLIKLRASWGRNGNESISPFQYTSTLTMGNNNVALGKGKNDQIYVGIVPSRFVNPAIKWETSEQTDIGVDFRFLDNSLSLSVDYFDKKTKDMILWLQIPKYLGYWGMNANSGTMSNKGFEFDANYRFKVGAVNLSVNGNASYVENIVTDRGPGFSSIAQLGAGLANPDVAIVESGMPYGYFRGYTHDGIFQNWDEVNAHVGPSGKLLQPNAQPGDVRFKNLYEDDLIDDKDLSMIGNPNPDWVYGFTLSGDWKNFDFSVFFQGVVGNQIFNYDRRPNVPYANWHRKWLGRWTGEGTSNWWPRVVEDDAANMNTSRVSNLYIEDGDYLRLKVLQLGYTLPANLTRKALVNNLRFYVQCDNLLTFSKYKGYDPEVGARSGMDSGTYPQARVFTVGASVNF